MFADIPRPPASQFTTEIDNPYLPLRPGTTFHYETPSTGEKVTVIVTNQTRVVDGVVCVVVHDTAREDGAVTEDTYDWYAQDAAGNVWYFGEDTAEYEPGNPRPVSTEGSWETGVDGALAGVVMLADPEVGIRYRQEYAAGEAEDSAEVRSLDASARVPYGAFDGHVLRTREVNPLDPSVETKLYVRGVGEVLAIDGDGAREVLTRIEVNGGPGGDHLCGYAGGDLLKGHGGSDVIRGHGGGDTLMGGRGADSIRGGQGADRLDGGSGGDLLRGGGGADVFVFHHLHDGKAATDTVADYDAGEFDSLRIHGGAASVIAETETCRGWALTLAGDGDVIRLPGVADANGDGHVIDDLLLV